MFVRIAPFVLALAACRPGPGASAESAPPPPHDVGTSEKDEPAKTASSEIAPSPEPEHASAPETETEPPPEPNPVVATPYPTVYCAYDDALAERWLVHIDPVEDAHMRRAVKLADRYPNADGHFGALSRSNVPEPWRELRDVTLLSSEGAVTTTVRKVGVRPSPSGAAFVFMLKAKPRSPKTEQALALEGHLPTGDLRWTTAAPTKLDEASFDELKPALTRHVESVRPGTGRPKLRARNVRALDVDLGGGFSRVLVITKRHGPGDFPAWSVMVAVAEDGTLHPVPIVQSMDGGPPGALDTAFFQPVAALDLDHDGHDELVVDEHWPEGLFRWIVRVDPSTGELTAHQLCGDAA